MSDAFPVPAELLERAHGLIERGASEGFRPMIGIAGPPASGKSTLAHALAERTGGIAVPMDGFHLDNPILEARGLRSRKGAPETFDAAGFLSLVRRLKEGDEVFAPLFDRERELAIAGALVVPEEAPLVVLEGNYLLLDQPVWRDVVPLARPVRSRHTALGRNRTASDAPLARPRFRQGESPRLDRKQRPAERHDGDGRIAPRRSPYRRMNR